MKKIIKQKFSKKALDALAKGDMATFGINVNKAIENDDETTLEILGETLYDSGNLVESEQIFNSLLKRDPNNTGAKIMLSDIFNEEGNTDQALLLLDEISSDDEHYLAVLMQKADIYQTLGLEEVSETLLKEAYKRSPNDLAVIFGMAELLYSEGKYKEALRYYQQILSDGITNYLNQNIKVRYANCLAFNGKFEESGAIFKSFNDILLHDEDLFSKASVFFELNEYQAAADALETLIDRTSDYGPAYLLLARSYENLDQLEDAYRVAERGSEIDEFDERILKEFASVAFKLGNFEQSKVGYKKILQRDPENIAALVDLSSNELKQQNDQEVVNLLTGKEALDPNLAWNLGKAYMNLDELQLAKQNLLLIFNEYKNNPIYLLDLIELFRKDFDIESLLSIMALYLNLIPTDDQIASEYERLKKEQEAND